VGSGAHTGSTRHCGHFWAIVPAPGDCDDGEFGGIKIGRGNRSIRRKAAAAPFCPPQIPLHQNRARTRAAAVGSQWLAAWAMARPSSSWSSATAPWFRLHGTLPIPTCILSDLIFVVSKYFQRDGTVELVQKFNAGTQLCLNFLTAFCKSGFWRWCTALGVTGFGTFSEVRQIQFPKPGGGWSPRTQ
jgi:hypothetical protein